MSKRGAPAFRNQSSSSSSHLGYMRVCPFCSFLTLSPMKFLRHLNTVHFTANHFKCDVCLKILSSKGSLANHRRVYGHYPNQKLNDTLVECRYCNFGSFDPTKVQQHERILHFNHAPCDLRVGAGNANVKNQVVSEGPKNFVNEFSTNVHDSDEVLIKLIYRGEVSGELEDAVGILYESTEARPVTLTEETEEFCRFACQFCTRKFMRSEHLHLHLRDWHDVVVTTVNTV